jgi:uncharacterized protein involved in type VI secretion and phage assembly
MSTAARVLAVGDESPHSRGWWPGVHLGLVTDVDDPLDQGRVKIHLPWMADTGSDRYESWARLSTLMAGAGRGTWFVPDVDDEVVVAFEGGDPSAPIVLGSLWNGVDSPPEQMRSGNTRRTILTRNGVRVELDDRSGETHILIETPGGQRVRLDDSPAKVTVEDSSGNVITLQASGVSVVTSGKASISAATVQVDASMVTVNAGMSTFSGVVKCDTLISNTVVSAAYTPGAGNIW